MHVTTSTMKIFNKNREKYGSRYYSRIRMSGISLIHHHLSSYSFLAIIDHNSKYTQKYENESTKYPTIISNPLLVYWWYHRLPSRVVTKERIQKYYTQCAKTFYIIKQEQKLRSLHNNQEFSVFLRININWNCGNTDKINFFDASNVKTENTIVLNLLQSIIELISIIESKDAGIYQAALWIPKNIYLIQFIFSENKSWYNTNPNNESSIYIYTMQEN